MNELTDRDESGLGWVYPPQPQQTFIQEIIGMISGVIELVEGQDYIDVVFGSAQPSANWVLIETSIFNTADAAPLNVWPGVVTSKTTAGFRLQLNGIPDSGNYVLNWSIRGVFGYYLTGPTDGHKDVASSPFTVRLPDDSTLTGTVIITLEDGGAGGTFTPATVALTAAAPLATFTYTPSTYGARSIRTVNDRGLVDPPEIGFVAVSASYTLDGPATGVAGVPSTDFTVALPVGGAVMGSVTVTPSDGGDGGTFTPTTVELSTAGPSATFTYTPASGGDKAISVTNDGGLTDPVNLVYAATGVLYDKFTASNGTLLDGRTPSPVTAGDNWTQIEGSTARVTIQSNVARFAAIPAVSDTLIVDSGISDCTARVKINFIGNGRGGLMFRATDINNWWEIWAGEDTNDLKLFRMNGGSFSVIDAQPFTFNVDTVYELKVVLSGNSIQCYVDGSLIISTTDAIHATATQVGLSASSDTVEFDDLLVEV